MNSQLSERMAVYFMDFDPSTSDTLKYNTDTAANANWINIENWHRVMCIVFRTVGTGIIQAGELRIASDVNGTGATAIASVGSTSCGGLLNAAQPSNDNTGERGAGMVVFEFDTKDVEKTLADGKYLQVALSCATGTDEFGICWILSDPRYAKADYTSDGVGTGAPTAV